MFVTVLLFAAMMLYAAPASALWSASVSVGVSISTAPQPSQMPVFRVGKSKATFVGGTGPFPTIAQMESGRLWLDFGAVAQGNSNNSRDILRLETPGPAPYELRTSLSSEIRDLFAPLKQMPEPLWPGESATLGMKIDSTRAAPGLYEGTLTVSDALGGFTSEIPIKVMVVEPSNGSKVTATIERRAQGKPDLSVTSVRSVPDRSVESTPRPLPEEAPAPEPDPAPQPAALEPAPVLPPGPPDAADPS
jgi:hypothetical protein